MHADGHASEATGGAGIETRTTPKVGEAPFDACGWRATIRGVADRAEVASVTPIGVGG